MKDWYFYCEGCERKLTGLRSRCLMQITDTKGKWNGHCLRCCCLNKRLGKECSDPSGLGWVKQ